MARYSYLIPAIMLSLCVFNAQSQTRQPLEKTLDNLQKQATDYPFEKVYLHLDKPYYGAGDTIWFKAYNVIGPGHLPSPVSGVLNVELINQKNYIVKQIKLRLGDGFAHGDIPLGDTITAGNYRVRAYTNWMRNFGESYYFDKTVQVINAVSNKVFTHTDYAYSSVDGQSMVNADIKYFSLDGKPFVGKTVKYNVRLSSNTLTSGNAITDATGNIHVTFNGSASNVTGGEVNTIIQLDNKAVSKSILIKALSQKVDVQFFPESGHLVNSTISKVAFKAIGADGLGADVKGTIVDDRGNEITTFASTHLGMGTFFLSPQEGRRYKAQMTFADGAKGTVDLPVAVDKGYVMTIHADTANVVVKISQKGFDGEPVTLVARSQGEVFLQGKGAPGKTAFTAVIPKTKLPGGIVQFTLFNNAGEPVNERLVFVQNEDQLHLMINTDKQGYAPREKVKLKFNAKDALGKPVEGNFSVAVIDESKVKTDEASENSILANLLLTSDLKGYVEQPNYYFAHPDKTTAADLDALLLTQGYRSYDWSAVISNTPPAINYIPENALQLSGTLKSKDGMALAKTKVTLISRSIPPQLVDTLTDSHGHFLFNLDFDDGEKFNIKASSANKENAKFEFDKSSTYATFNKNRGDMLINPESWLQNYLQTEKAKYEAEVKYNIGNHSALLKEVTVNTSKPKTEREIKVAQAVEFSSNLNGKGNADQVVIAEDFAEGCHTLQECLAGKLLGVVFIGGYPYTNRPITFDPSKRSTSGRIPMMLVVDGIAGSPLPPILAVSSVEVLRSGAYTAMYGTRAAGGVVIITTNHGNGFLGEVKSNDAIQPQGFYKPNVFYSPKYEVAKPVSVMPDLRSTVYWNPSVQTDDEGSASFTYCNADGKGTYRVVIEGIDKAGSLGRKVIEYKVD